MITRVLAAALAAGFAAGLIVAALQHVTTTPLIVAAEAYEGEAHHHHASMRSHMAEFHGARLILAHAGHDDDEWAPDDGLERTFYTSTVTVATAVGFAFLLLAGLLFAGDPIGPRRALGWAAAGFVVTGLAPALGLPPELPGMQAADLFDRQVWWIGTAIATAAALWLLFRSGNVALAALGVALLIAPHVIGAPHPAETEASRVPAELAARFASASLAVHAVLWALVGLVVGWYWQRSEPPASA